MTNHFNMTSTVKGYVFVIVMSFVLCSCVSIPQQAPQLSEELGKKISLLNHSHLNLVHKYFDQKRDLVDDFMEKVWLPEFAKNFFENDEIQKAWDEVVKSQDAKDRVDFLVFVGPKLQRFFNAKRQELINPLNDLETELVSSLQEEYNIALSANNTLTSFLTSAAKVKENQQRYLNMLGITQDKISSVIDQTDSALENLVSKGQQVATGVDKVKQYSQQADEFKQKISDLKKNLK